MQTDKKTYKGNIHFILCKGIGAAFIKKNIDKNIVKKQLRNLYLNAELYLIIQILIIFFNNFIRIFLLQKQQSPVYLNL